MKLVRRLVIKVNGEVREYDLTTTVEQVKKLKDNSNDFEVIEYREGNDENNC